MWPLFVFLRIARSLLKVNASTRKSNNSPAERLFLIYFTPLQTKKPAPTPTQSIICSVSVSPTVRTTTMDNDTTVYSNCASPATYQPYTWTLSDKLRKTAKSELREDEHLRTQGLAQMREFIAKSPHIKRCRTDALFLLRFLRTKKYSIPQACAMLEKYLTVRQTNPVWFERMDVDDPEIAAIIDGGYIVPLPERDDHGRQVVLSVAGNLDLSRVSSALLARVHFLVQEVLADDEQSQICGYVHCVDERELSMKLMGMWSLVDIKKVADCIQNGLPNRINGFNLIGMPSTAATLLEFCVSLLSDKLRKRINVSNGMKWREC